MTGITCASVIKRARSKRAGTTGQAAVEGKGFDSVNQGDDYQRGRYRSRVRGSAVRWLPFLLSLLLTAIPAYYGLKRDG